MDKHVGYHVRFGSRLRDNSKIRSAAAAYGGDIGRKVAAIMISLGLRDVQVETETDKIFTVIGRIDAERRWNWEKQFQAARPHVIQIIGSETGADQFVTDFLRHYDDPATCSITTLHFTRGYA